MKVALLIATMLATTVLVDSDAVGFRINHRNDKNTGPRSDLRCGSNYGNAICDPYGKYPCCSDWYHCGNTAAHCDCSGCVDYRGKRGEDEKKEVLQDAAAVLKEVVQEAEKEAAMDLLERIASLDGSVAVPQDPAAEWEKKQEEAEEDAEEKLEEELEVELEELEEELKNKEGDHDE